MWQILDSWRILDSLLYNMVILGCLGGGLHSRSVSSWSVISLKQAWFGYIRSLLYKQFSSILVN